MKRYALVVAVVVGAAGWGTAADDADKALKELDGEYTVKALSQGGQAAPADVVKGFEQVTFKDGVLSIKVMGETKTAKVKVDVTQKPAHFDMTQQDGPEQGITLKGVYKLDKGELTIVLTAPDRDRPDCLDGTAEQEMKFVLTTKKK